eukprot:TRINITY_DN235_c1_g2_i1.p1 TRINITY_DN235_c1_g2~~TRINITY_DN235_c1_g2_i1.p1  ORF type:complete len:662 (+),score=92.42 TRINITY_DN235_c1_g2_i1:89-1987(+)
MPTETYAFQSESKEVFDLVSKNTLTADQKEIFLRELIRNASDALDKRRYMGIRDGRSIPDEENRITIVIDKENGTLTVSDHGIGMTKSEMVHNLGSVRRRKVDLMHIEGYGIHGFYSTFLVSNKVTAVSKTVNSEACIWECSANGTFDVRETDDFQYKCGTQITCRLKDDQLEYLDEEKVREIVQKHAKGTSGSILVGTKARDGLTVIQKLTLPVSIWQKDPRKVTAEQYNAFYSTISADTFHLGVKHIVVEGMLEFRGVIFVPRQSPDIFEKRQSSMSLYVRGTQVLPICNELVPEYLCFLEGVVDSEDLPLNISPEMLVSNKIFKVMKKHVTRHALRLFEEISQNKKDYDRFYSQYGRYIKLGLHEDTSNRGKLADLVRYNSTKFKTELTSLSEYVERMEPGQEFIYYAMGDSMEVVEKSLLLQHIENPDHEVLIMTDPIDEYVMQQVKEYNGKKFHCVGKYPETEIQEQPETDPETEPVTEHTNLKLFIRNVLKDKVSKVTMSDRLTQKPCLIKSNAGSRSLSLELNTSHPIIQALSARVGSPAPTDALTEDLVIMLFESALMECGLPVGDPTKLVGSMRRMMRFGLSLDDEEDDFVFVRSPSPVEPEPCLAELQPPPAEPVLEADETD